MSLKYSHYAYGQVPFRTPCIVDGRQVTLKMRRYVVDDNLRSSYSCCQLCTWFIAVTEITFLIE